ncbi:MAG TPA: tetratricopeptide repeat protein [Burkholderiales bacterium]|nr:tetratricopeptide repeat protein [Burkholderiales bacterium]
MAAAPDPFQPLLAQASADLQAGRHRAAEGAYREILARAPDHAVATHFLGICMVQTGRTQEGLAALAQSMRALGRQARFRHNYALMLAQAGDPATAERELEEAIALEPGNVTSHNYLGIVRQKLGRLEDAAAAYRAALAIAPDDPLVASNYGNCLLAKGEVEAAIDLLRRSVGREPRNPVAHNNLGSALNAAGDVRGAIAAYRKAVEVEPRYAPGWYNLGLGLRAVGDDDGSIEALRRAVQAGPEFAPAWQAYADAFAKARFLAWDPQAAQDLARALLHPSIDPGPLAEAAASLLVLDPAFAPVFRDVRSPEASVQALAHPMLLALIENALVPDPAFEAFLCALRRRALEDWRSGALTATPRSIDLACALAQQCFLNEYVWPESAAEAAEVQQLAESVRTAPDALAVALVAAYRPLGAMPGLAPPPGAGESFKRLWQRQVEEPAAERRLRDQIEALTPIDDDTSRAVQQQYEENPYPRWHRVPASLSSPFPLRRALREHFPHADPSRLRVGESPGILIAGCGSGYQAVITALRNPGSRILAIDLSRTSLAYAMRRCRELQIGHVRFGQADILKLGALPDRFDLIECAGVLHHLRDPLAGWRVLESLLKPGGVMKIALYSERARQGVVAARELIARHGLGADLEGVRAARQLVFAAPEASPARTVTLGRDFYSASGARDLVMHVQEHRFTTAQLAEMLRTLGLELLGFEFGDPSVPAAYLNRFPEDRAATSLENWGRFEDEHPEVFAGMYQFWCAKPA